MYNKRHPVKVSSYQNCSRCSNPIMPHEYAHKEQNRDNLGNIRYFHIKHVVDKMKINKIVIHCAATPNGREHDATEIHQWHLQRGWSGIGYHYVIKLDGTIEKGRPDYWQGAHASNHNKNSLGICLIGTDDFTAEQWDSLYKLVVELTEKYNTSNVIGHNEISSKTCPGFDVKEWCKRNLIK